MRRSDNPSPKNEEGLPKIPYDVAYLENADCTDFVDDRLDLPPEYLLDHPRIALNHPSFCLSEL